MLFVTTLLVPKTTTAPEMELIVVALQFWVKVILHWIVGLCMKTVSTTILLGFTFASGGSNGISFFFTDKGGNDTCGDLNTAGTFSFAPRVLDIPCEGQ